ncbi:hypothetical protein DWB63_14325 [Pseudodesulfovibrio sp. S3]|nr:hypothetical protein DWB63_14325 [Pseudodesulfovibrio sp. S3]
MCCLLLMGFMLPGQTETAGRHIHRPRTASPDRPPAPRNLLQASLDTSVALFMRPTILILIVNFKDFFHFH